MKRRTSGYRSDSELLSHNTAEDLSLQLQGGYSSAAVVGGSFLEAKNLFDHGTEQLRQLLLRECSLIYECSRCRNMFRELSSFITHKRVYCGTYAIRKGCNNRNGSQEQPKASSGSSNFNELLWRWLKAVGGNAKPPNTQGYCRSRDSAAMTPCHDLHNKVGNAAHGTAHRRSATQTASIVVDDSSAALSLNCNNHRFICNVCKLSFQTNRSLKLHRHKKHVASRYAFQCPNCVLNFQQPAAVVRHLSKVHKLLFVCLFGTNLVIDLKLPSR